MHGRLSIIVALLLGVVCSSPAHAQMLAELKTNLATEPQPRNGWMVVEGGKYLLQWKPAIGAKAEVLHFAPTAPELDSASSPLPLLAGSLTSATLPMANLKAGQTYYWRVDTMDAPGANAKVTSKGDVWSFRVAQKKLRVYLLGGQSNMTGEADFTKAPADLPQSPNAIIFLRGQMDRTLGGKFGWDFVKPGLGSNRQHFGPEVGFAHAMTAAHPGEIIALIKCSWGGTNLDQRWRPPSSGGRVGPLYSSFVRAVHDGMEAIDPNFEADIQGMIWMQGEEDALQATMAPHYEENLTNFIKDIRAEVKKPELPFIIGQIAEAPVYASPKFGAQVRAAQKTVSEKVPHTAIFATSDYKLTDPWHYDAAGQLSLGERFAAALIKLEK